MGIILRKPHSRYTPAIWSKGAKNADDVCRYDIEPNHVKDFRTSEVFAHLIPTINKRKIIHLPFF